jgi:flagellar biosynthetic protein FliQ
MDQFTAIEIAKEAIWVLIKVSLPIMLTALVVGLIISLIQALTQVQEMTLSFVPKIIAIFFALVIFLPYIGAELKGLHEFLNEKMILVSQTSNQISEF